MAQIEVNIYSSNPENISSLKEITPDDINSSMINLGSNLVKAPINIKEFNKNGEKIYLVTYKGETQRYIK